MSLSAEDQKIHDDMLGLLVPLIDFLNVNQFSYLINVAREGTGSNYMNGAQPDLVALIGDLSSRNPQVYKLLDAALNKSLD